MGRRKGEEEQEERASATGDPEVSRLCDSIFRGARRERSADGGAFWRSDAGRDGFYSLRAARGN